MIGSIAKVNKSTKHLKLLGLSFKKQLAFFSRKEEEEIEKEIERMRVEFLSKQIHDDKQHMKVIERPGKMQDRDPRLNLQHIQIQDPLGERDPEFTRPKGILEFYNETLSPKNGSLIIEEISRSGFTIGGAKFLGSLVMFRDQIFNWDIQDAEDIRGHVFDIVKYIKPRPGNY